ncbi:hypothetical protein [Nocardioides nitrophenolicus]|uniref:hypothetical protein n=1 Tax=Nocardioides nitrophenolicus TaxID=60489 RepID=UPI00195EC37A|nr:hypothetical protein [Nocardioides nitrophenolicus]MBM7519242.1 hypothetical protein [Nocardioides nitrophenolicus]
MPPLPRVLAALACAAGLLLASPGLASAADLVHTDPARDVLVGDIEGDRTHPAPGERRVDIRRVTVSHGLDSLIVSLRTRGPLPTKRFFVGARLKTSAGSFEVTYASFYGESGVSLTRNLDDIACEGLTATVEARTATLVVPTACLGTPAWARVGVGVAQMRKKRMVVDDGFSKGVVGDDLRLSKRIARG